MKKTNVRQMTMTAVLAALAFAAVSYTHLDVYKRQGSYRKRNRILNLFFHLADTDNQLIRG